LSSSGKFISSQNTTNHLFGDLGLNETELAPFTYSQYLSNYFNINYGSVEDEKFTNIISKSVKFYRVDIKVMVLPDPGGPQIIKGLCSKSHPHKTS
jgi:hypothetical protein